VPDHCWTWQWLEEDEQLFVEFPNLGAYAYARLGTEWHDLDVWQFEWADDPPTRSRITPSRKFSNHFKRSKDDLLSRGTIELSKVNGDYLGVIATEILGASAYFAWPDAEQNATSFYLIFDMPLVGLNPAPLQRLVSIVHMMSDSMQVKDKALATRQFLYANGFQSKITEQNKVVTEEFFDGKDRKIIRTEQIKKTKRGERKIVSLNYEIGPGDCVPNPIMKTVSAADYEIHHRYFVRAPLNREVEIDVT